VAQLVEHHLAKVRVAGSSPVFRSVASLTGFGMPATSGGRGFVLPLWLH
jgi:hypothetical protein